MITEKYPLVFPIHPRTLANLKKMGLEERFQAIKQLIIMPPLDYFAFQKLVHNCKYVITDSGGIQEETTFRGVPCITLRPNTERPSTITEGTNTLSPFELTHIKALIDSIIDGSYKKGRVPKYWDGKATERIAEAMQIVL